MPTSPAATLTARPRSCRARSSSASADPALLNAALALMVAFNASRSEPPSTKVEYAFELRDDQEMAGRKAKLHAELFGYFAESPKSLTLGEFERMTGEDPAELSAKILKPN